jgi:hypothetical protein
MDGNDRATLQALERLRRRWEAVEYALGDAYDYLDRGHPSDEQRDRTWEMITVKRQEAEDLKRQLEAMVTELHTHRPAVIERWAALHQAVYREVCDRYARAPDTAIPPPEVAQHIARQALEEWAAVGRGEQTAVEYNRYLMDQNQDIAAKHFGF